MGKIQTPEDVFDLPIDMSATVASENFARAKEDVDMFSSSQESGGSGGGGNSHHASMPLVRALWAVFWKPFLGIGSLRLLADLCGFASPILLNAVINFMENRAEDVRWGYLYALGLFASTVSVALLNAHFNLLMAELTIKVKSALVTSVYRHTLATPAYVMR